MVQKLKDFIHDYPWVRRMVAGYFLNVMVGVQLILLPLTVLYIRQPDMAQPMLGFVYLTVQTMFGCYFSSICLIITQAVCGVRSRERWISLGLGVISFTILASQALYGRPDILRLLGAILVVTIALYPIFGGLVVWKPKVKAELARKMSLWLWVAGLLALLVLTGLGEMSRHPFLFMSAEIAAYFGLVLRYVFRDRSLKGNPGEL